MKYLILDAEKLQSHWTLWERLTTGDYMLSPEESMDKFKEIFDAGSEAGYTTSTSNELDEQWREFKKEL